MAGYSGTPLVQKLGIKPGFSVAFINAPEDFASNLGLTEDVTVRTRASARDLDFILLFVKNRADLSRSFLVQAARIKPNGMMWISWPKKTSGVKTDLTENVVRDIGLAAGLVDVKVCAVDDVWSGLKFVYRVKDRSKIKLV